MVDGDTERRSWRAGCGYVVFSLLFFLVVAGLVALRPVRQAKRIEEQLNAHYGAASAYTPAFDGAVSPDRMEVFLAVRDRLREPLESLTARQARLEEFGEAEQTGEVGAGDLIDGFKAAFSGGPGFIRLMRARNEALTAEGMGIGEYGYIYAAAYNRQLARMARLSEQNMVFKTRTRKTLTQVLRNQLTVLESSRHMAELESLATDLREEIVLLETGTHNVPWQSGLPADIEASLTPYRDRLDELFCEPAARFELRQKNQHPTGLGR